MSASLTTEERFICTWDSKWDPSCPGEPNYEHENKRYCVHHFPSKEKRAEFREAFQQKVDKKDFKLSHVWFPDVVLFSHFEFNGAVDFSAANFSAGAFFTGANFKEEADFNGATFGGPMYFQRATFSAVDFADVTFIKVADFYSVTFGAAPDFTDATFIKAADFRNATFVKAADFSGATFGERTFFSSATFEDYVKFARNKNPVFSQTSSLDLQFVRIEKPEHVLFHSLSVHPHWFVNSDPRKFDFIDVVWSNPGKARPEIELLKRRQISSPYRLLAISCRRLAANAEENDRYREASHFRRMAMDAERLETWRGFGFLRLSWWYWLASGYGERPFQAFMVLIGILLISAALYSQVGFARWEPKLASESDLVIAKRDDVGTPLKFSRALTYSAGVMTLQKPEPRPATTAAQTLVLLETILGPVQAALLALAIRRKFMR